MFPAVDPIPLPAPVWLFKVLHLLTLALHFGAMQILVGALFIAVVWATLGRRSGAQPMLDAAGIVSNRLPIVMTYVINLGVPPLLFTQVLYGRAIYSSSVLMGAWWISVVGILMFSYALLYSMNARAEKGRAYGWLGLISLLGVLAIGKIYVANMTLMLRPEVWLEMYRADMAGAQLPTGDPTIMPRFALMMLGSLAPAGAFLMFLAQKKFVSDEAANLLGRAGGRMAAVGAVAAIACGFWVFRSQPEAVQTGVMANTLFKIMAFAFLGTAAVLALVGGAAGFRASAKGWLLPVLAGLVSFLNIGALVIFRDGMRDVALLAHGYDVWQRTIVTNWSVVGIFMLLFVVGLGVIGWLASVVARTEGMRETYA